MKEGKTSRHKYTRGLRLFFFITLVMILPRASAQLSTATKLAEGLPVPPSTPAPTPEAASPDRHEARQSFVIDRNSDRYRFVFPSGSGPLRDDFTEQLNKAGEQGYRFISVVYHWESASGYRVPIAIVERDHVQHEFASFAVAGKLAFIITGTGFEQKYRELAQRGFDLIDYHLIWVECDKDCGDDKEFLLERKKGVETPTQFILAYSSVANPKARMGPELTEQVKEKLAAGFYPSYVFSKWELLLTRAENGDGPLTDHPELQVITSSFRHDVKEKVNDLAKQGYRLLLANSGIAVMYRRSHNVKPVSYVWLDVDAKDFARRLLELQGLGVIYRMPYPNREGTKRDKLIFELGAGGEGQRREYEVLKFKLQGTKDAAKKVHLELTPSSKETMKSLNRLAKDGFIVRDLLTGDQISVILERSH